MSTKNLCYKIKIFAMKWDDTALNFFTKEKLPPPGLMNPKL